MVCDDMEEIRQYFEWLINSQEDMQAVPGAESGKQAVEYAQKYKPDVILMDVQMEEATDGIRATSDIIEMMPDVRVIMLTIHKDDGLLIDSYVAGAVDYIIKETEVETIYDTIRLAYSNKYFVGRTIARAVKERFNRGRDMEASALYFINNMSRLTNGEWKILHHLYSGKKRREIAEIEVLSEETVKFHIRNILKKLRFSSTAEMISFLKDFGVLEKFKL